MDNHPPSSRIRSNSWILRLPIAQVQRTYHGRGHNASERYWSGLRRKLLENSVKRKFDFLEFTFYALGGIGR